MQTTPRSAATTPPVATSGPHARTRWSAITSRPKPWTRWWWLGSAVDRDGITAALQQYADAGIGGVEVCPIYGAMGAENRFVPFLSDAWMSLLNHALGEANRLGMSLELTTGTGWPFGGPNIEAEHSSCKLVLARHEVTSGRLLDEPLPAGDVEHALAVDPHDKPLDLTATIAAGRIRWQAPAGGPWRVIIAVRQSAIQRVKRAAPGGEGNVVDPYSVAAIDHYLARFDAALNNSAGPKPHGHFHDSFEYYDANWTRSLLAEFQRRRGYDLRPQIAALAGIGFENIAARVRCDYRQTIAELHLDYVVRWVEWCHRHGGIAREQAHGAPANLIDLYAAADVPETEMFGPPDEGVVPMNKLASSASHLAGRGLTSAESFTWLGEHFQVTLADAKAEADLLFLAGINRLVFHGIAYSPADVPWPGWLFYAAVHFGPTGGLWHDLPSFTGYLARCQSVLQSGRPSRDVLLYFPIFDFWQTSEAAATTATSPSTSTSTSTSTSKPASRLLPIFGMHDEHLPSHPFHATSMTLWRGGYLFDQVSDHFLSTARFENGHIEIGGMRYSTIVVPPCRVMPPETLRHMLDLATAGATVIIEGELPDEVPGLLNADARRSDLRLMLAELEGDEGERVISVGRGRVIRGPSLERMLKGASTPREPMADVGLLCERRAHDGGYAYFIVNRAAEPVDGWIPLGTRARAASLLDPRSEARAGVAAIRQHAEQTEVYLQLLPGESVVVQTFGEATAAGEPWAYTASAGKARSIEGRWHVAFIEGGPALPTAFETDRLASWTEAPDPEAKRFAGTARYRIEIEHAEVADVDDWWLDLGRVCESARARVNGRDIGTVWCAPFRLPIGRGLRPGRNAIEIEVTNLAANRIADLDRQGVPWKRFHEINFVDKAYKKFDASGWPPRHSGLLGPVRLVPIRYITPA